MTQRWCFLGTTQSCSSLSLSTLDLLTKILILGSRQSPSPLCFSPSSLPSHSQPVAEERFFADASDGVGVAVLAMSGSFQPPGPAIFTMVSW